MGISPEVEAQYESNRLRMLQVNSGFRRFMWLSIILGAMIFSTSFFAGAASTLHDHQEGPSIFYYAMSSGAFQILFGLVTILLGWLTAMKNRVPSLISLGIDAVGFLTIILGKNGTFSVINIVFVMLGIALNIWAQMLCNADDELKSQPGYPLFSVQADYRAHYEVPADVLARKAQASTHMAEIGRAAANPETAPEAVPAPNLFLNPTPVKLPPEVKLSAETAQSLGISEMTGSAPQFVPKAEALAAPTDVSLDSLTVQTPQVSEAALPQIDAADMLADMTAIPSHATLKGNPDMLPTPEEVKARLAAMKKARAEHHPEG
ncbi:MAG: hypothetical protein IJM46_11995 [Oscillospiraceae bacterium]|nr:hypothetical protein [Oscillospiraceae bacterium]